MQRHKPLAEMLIYLPPYLSKFQPPVLFGLLPPYILTVLHLCLPPYILVKKAEALSLQAISFPSPSTI